MSLFTLFARSREQWRIRSANRPLEDFEAGLDALTEAELLFLDTPVANTAKYLARAEAQLEEARAELANQLAENRALQARLDAGPLPDQLSEESRERLARLMALAGELDLPALRTHYERPIQELAYRLLNLQRSLNRQAPLPSPTVQS